jgi:hypothetical protein
MNKLQIYVAMILGAYGDIVIFPKLLKQKQVYGKRNLEDCS